MAMMGNTVTVDEAYFLTLLQRANSPVDYQHVDELRHNQPASFMCLPMDKYHELFLSHRQYENMRENLLRAGLDEKELTILIEHNTPQLHLVHSLNKAYQQERDKYVIPPRRDDVSKHKAGGAKNKGYAKPDVEAKSESTGPSSTSSEGSQNQNTSVVISGLPMNTSYHDVTSAVHGGPLREVSMTPQNKCQVATVSFIKAEDAETFYSYSKKNGISISNARAVVSWSSNQSRPSTDLVKRIGRGATRSLFIRNCRHYLTEEEIKEDLDHIHNLVVVKVEFLLRHCTIETNSISCASFAKACLMSRSKYASSAILYAADTCNRQAKVTPTPPDNARVKQAAKYVRNRYAVLAQSEDNKDSISK